MNKSSTRILSLFLVVMLAIAGMSMTVAAADLTVDVEAGSGGSIGVSTLGVSSGATWADIMGKLPTPVPASGYKFLSWLVDGNHYFASLHKAIPTSGAKITAQFVTSSTKTYEIKLNAGTGGSLPLGASSITIVDGTTWGDLLAMLPQPTAGSGYTFLGWVNADGVYLTSIADQPITGDVSLTARFSDGTYTWGSFWNGGYRSSSGSSSSGNSRVDRNLYYGDGTYDPEKDVLNNGGDSVPSERPSSGGITNANPGTGAETPANLISIIAALAGSLGALSSYKKRK